MTSDRAAALNLLELLKREKTALENNDIEALETITLDKLSVMEGFTHRPSNDRSALATQDGALEQVLRECRDLNDHNFRLVIARQRVVSDLLSTIRDGGSAAAPVYGKDGQLTPLDSNSLGTS